MPLNNADQTEKLKAILDEVHVRIVKEGGPIKMSNGTLTEDEAERILACIQDGADVNVMNSNKRSALDYAIDGGDLPFIQSLLDKGTRQVNDPTPEYQLTLLMIASNSSKSSATIDMLISRGADVNAKAENGFTALAFACMVGNNKIVERLLNEPTINKESINSAIDFGDEHNNALAYAVYQCSTENVKLLLKAGAEMPEQNPAEHLVRGLDFGYDKHKPNLRIAKNVIEILSARFEVKDILRDTMLNADKLRDKYKNGITIGDIDQLSKTLKAYNFIIEGVTNFNKSNPNYSPIEIPGIKEFGSVLNNLIKETNRAQSKKQPSGVFFQTLDAMHNASNKIAKKIASNRKPITTIAILTYLKDKFTKSRPKS